MKVEIKKNAGAGEINVSVPYSLDFNDKAKKLGGKWAKSDYHGGKWVFNAQVENLVRDLCLDIFGTDGTMSVNTVTVKIKKSAYHLKGPVSFHGRTLASAYGRDTGAKLGVDVALLDGEITSGGSFKNWYTEVNGTFLIHNFPKSKAEKLGLEIIEQDIDVKIKNLETERTRVVAWLAEIDSMLSSLKAN